MIGLTAPAFGQTASAKLGSHVTVDGVKKDGLYAFLVSDLFYKGDAEQLKSNCAYAMTAQKQYRVFITNYQATAAVAGDTGKGRFVKQNEILHLLQAGSTFVFESRKQMDGFKAIMKGESFTHGQIAGFNGIFYYDPNEKGSI